jgi:hypothetical protein
VGSASLPGSLSILRQSILWVGYHAQCPQIAAGRHRNTVEWMFDVNTALI